MTEPRLTLSLLPDTFAICRLDRRAEIPTWALAGDFISITRTADELSIVCAERHVPEGVEREGGWRALRVDGPLDFSLPGILSAIAQPLARAAIPIFALSTYRRDYVMVRQSDLEKAVQALTLSGHQVSL